MGAGRIPRALSGFAAGEARGSEKLECGVGNALGRGAPCLQGRARTQLSPHKGQLVFYALLSASTGKPSWPHVHLVSVPCSYCVPFVSLPYLLRGAEAWGVGTAKDTGSALWGPVGQARVGSHPRRKGHSEVGRKAATTPPPLASKEKGAGGGGGGAGGEAEACRVSSLLPGTLGRAEQAMVLDSQALSPCQLPQ